MKTLPLLFLFLSSLVQAAPSDSQPQFQTQVQSPAGSLIDTRDRNWTLSTGTDSITSSVSGSVGRTWTLLNSTDSVNAVQSGTWNITNISGTISLPTGASTSANQTNASQKTQIVDGAGAVISSTSNSLDVNTKVALTANGPNSVSVGTSSTSVLASNASRTGAVFTNTSAAIIYIGINTAALAGKGITLYPGGTWYMDEYSYSTASINAIATLAASVLDYQEFQ